MSEESIASSNVKLKASPIEGIEINDLDELKATLARAYWIETQLELSIQWEAYLSTNEKYRDILFKISHDSAGHRARLKKLCKVLKGIDIEKNVSAMKLRDWDFKRLLDIEIMGEILKHDQLALDLYEKLYKYTDRKFLKGICSNGGYEEFFEIFKFLVDAEKDHIKLLTRHVGRLERII